MRLKMPKKKGGKKKAAGAKAGKAKTNPLVAAGVPRFGCAAPQSENFSTAAPGLRAPALRGRGLPLPRAHALRGGRAGLGGVVWALGAACSASPPRVCAPRCSQLQTAAHIKSLCS